MGFFFYYDRYSICHNRRFDYSEVEAPNVGAEKLFR